MLFTVSSLKTVCSTVLEKKPNESLSPFREIKRCSRIWTNFNLIPLSNSRVLCGNFGWYLPGLLEKKILIRNNRQYSFTVSSLSIFGKDVTLHLSFTQVVWQVWLQLVQWFLRRWTMGPLATSLSKETIPDIRKGLAKLQLYASRSVKTCYLSPLEKECGP